MLFATAGDRLKIVFVGSGIKIGFPFSIWEVVISFKGR